MLGASMILAAVGGAQAGIVSPRGGGPYPDAYLDVAAREKGAYALKHAWIDRRERQRAGDVRFAVLSGAASASAILSPAAALSGGLHVPVVLGAYADVTPIVTNASLDRELFTGPWTPGTLTQFWSEVSFGLLDVSGAVYDWVSLSENEAYYTGGVPYYGIYPGVSRTGEMIGEILDARDGAVDFGDFDNDGPDGVPNSGDDDGYVDVLLVVHPTIGAECNYSPHMWSHSWVYSAWPESGHEPYRTNDSRAGGGSILIDDYIIVPSLSCGGAMIEIGVICHEIGHAIGLPDLYDSNGGGNGIGYWGLMGSGNWNTPSSPAHPDAWCREQLGWLNPVEIDWRAAKRFPPADRDVRRGGEASASHEAFRAVPLRSRRRRARLQLHGLGSGRARVAGRGGVRQRLARIDDPRVLGRRDSPGDPRVRPVDRRRG